MKLRPYQQRAIDQLYQWFQNHETGNPCLVLPTGSGKSLIIAALVRDALTNWPETRVLMLTHVKELIQQNTEKLLAVWPGAPLGIFSAGIGRKELHEPITYAGVQSIWRHAEDLGHIDLCLIDECHLVGHKDEGQYRKVLADLAAINPALRVIGLTATPFRLGHGLITDKPALFDDLITPVTIEELVYGGFLAPLRSKVTETTIDVSEVSQRGGEFVAGELEKAVDQQGITDMIVEETLRRASHCKSILFFCTGVDHAEHVAEALSARGEAVACVTGETPKGERQRVLEGFRGGKIRCLTNANVLTTGFDAPNIDCVVMARPTMSPGLYVQMAGRGMRLKDHTDHCLVLDFAGNVRRHGPITAVEPPTKAGKNGSAPVKTCPTCSELVHASVRNCPECGHEFPAPEPEPKPPPRLHNDDIMGLTPLEMPVTAWRWRKHVSRASGKEMLTCTYYSPAGQSVLEYLPVLHEGQFGARVRATLAKIAQASGVPTLAGAGDLESAADILTTGTPPRQIKYTREGKFYKVIERSFA